MVGLGKGEGITWKKREGLRMGKGEKGWGRKGGGKE
jgi:hypothetical protein